MLFGSTMLEVAIGIVFVYLLLSMLCSAISEYIEAVQNYRGRNLWKGIQLLLNGQIDTEIDKPAAKSVDQKSGSQTLTPHPEGQVGQADGQSLATQSNQSGKQQEEDLASQLYQHGLIRALFKDEDRLPSYIPARTFALALWNLAGGGAGGDTTDLDKIKGVINTEIPNEQLRQALITLIDEAEGDFDRARKNIEDWYDSAMDRVSGWYKRHVQAILLVIGIIVAALINADTINIGKALVQNDALRATVVAQAEKAAAQPAPTASPTPTDPTQRAADAQAKFQQTRSELTDLGLPLGWVKNDYDKDTHQLKNANDLRRLPNNASEAILKIIGLLLTGLAISQGAPFWFDVLNKFMVIRSTVKPKEKSPNEGSKDKTSNRKGDQRDSGNVSAKT
jgi:hypothetical protein